MNTRPVAVLVEGVAIVREPVEAALIAAGVEVRSAASGQAALSLLGSEVPGVLVIDLDLPGGQGWTVLAHARSVAGWDRAPVIVLSTPCDKTTVVRAAKYRVDAFIIKSKFNLPVFVERVRAALGGGVAAASAHEAIADGATDDGGPPIARTAPAPADPAEALKSIKPILTRSEMAECVDRCEQLRAFSPTVAMLLKITSNKDCSMERVVKAASHDHAITLKILKLANSVAFGRGDPVDSLKSAVMRIGLDKIRQAVMNIGLIEQFDGGSTSVNLPHFWEHAIGCAVIAADLAQSTGVMDPESAFTAGLLHDVGRIVLLEQLAERYVGVVEKARALRLPLEQVESRMLLINHADVMDRLLHAWKFSRHLINPVVFHHLSAGGIRQTCPREVGPVGVLALANRLAHAMLLGSSGNDFVYPTADLCRALRLDGATLAGACETGRTQTLEIKVAMLSQSVGGAWTSFRDQVRDLVRAPFRPLFAGAEPAIDAFRVFLETLAGPAASEPETPNVGVVHLSSARDIAAASTRYASAEQAAGCGRIPLIVVSPLAQLNVDPGLAAGRTVVRLPSPMSIHQFAETVNTMLTSESPASVMRQAA
jgi:HD-like signal output (HDOD) protein/DNA-binding NarL/FixJ family response regulator